MTTDGTAQRHHHQEKSNGTAPLRTRRNVQKRSRVPLTPERRRRVRMAICDVLVRNYGYTCKPGRMKQDFFLYGPKSQENDTPVATAMPSLVSHLRKPENGHILEAVSARVEAFHDALVLDVNGAEHDQRTQQKVRNENKRAAEITEIVSSDARKRRKPSETNDGLASERDERAEGRGLIGEMSSSKDAHATPAVASPNALPSLRLNKDALSSIRKREERDALLGLIDLATPRSRAGSTLTPRSIFDGSGTTPRRATTPTPRLNKGSAFNALAFMSDAAAAVERRSSMSLPLNHPKIASSTLTELAQALDERPPLERVQSMPQLLAISTFAWLTAPALCINEHAIEIGSLEKALIDPEGAKTGNMLDILMTRLCVGARSRKRFAEIPEGYATSLPFAWWDHRLRELVNSWIVRSKIAKDDLSSRLSRRTGGSGRPLLRRAVAAALAAGNTTRVAKLFGIPARTLRRHVAKERKLLQLPKPSARSRGIDFTAAAAAAAAAMRASSGEGTTPIRTETPSLLPNMPMKSNSNKDVSSPTKRRRRSKSCAVNKTHASNGALGGTPDFGPNGGSKNPSAHDSAAYRSSVRSLSVQDLRVEVKFWKSQVAILSGQCDDWFLRYKSDHFDATHTLGAWATEAKPGIEYRDMSTALMLGGKMPSFALLSVRSRVRLLWALCHFVLQHDRDVAAAFGRPSLAARCRGVSMGTDSRGRSLWNFPHLRDGHLRVYGVERTSETGGIRVLSRDREGLRRLLDECVASATSASSEGVGAATKNLSLPNSRVMASEALRAMLRGADDAEKLATKRAKEGARQAALRASKMMRGSASDAVAVPLETDSRSSTSDSGSSRSSSPILTKEGTQQKEETQRAAHTVIPATSEAQLMIAAQQIVASQLAKIVSAGADMNGSVATFDSKLLSDVRRKMTVELAKFMLPGMNGVVTPSTHVRAISAKSSLPLSDPTEAKSLEKAVSATIDSRDTTPTAKVDASSPVRKAASTFILTPETACPSPMLGTLQIPKNANVGTAFRSISSSSSDGTDNKLTVPLNKRRVDVFAQKSTTTIAKMCREDALAKLVKLFADDDRETSSNLTLCGKSALSLCGLCRLPACSTSLLSCSRSRCGRVFHRECLTTPLVGEIPARWICPICALASASKVGSKGRDSKTKRPQGKGDKQSKSAGTTKTDKKSGKRQTRRRRCGRCDGCLRPQCGQCRNCLDKPCFGGRGTLKQACKLRVCVAMRLPASTKKCLRVKQESKNAIAVVAAAAAAIKRNEVVAAQQKRVGVATEALVFMASSEPVATGGSLSVSTPPPPKALGVVPLLPTPTAL